MTKKSNKIRKLLLLLAIAGTLINFASGLYYIGYTDGSQFAASEQSFYSVTTVYLHLLNAFCLCICVLGIWLNSLFSLIGTLVALLLMCIGYVWWYFEKYTFLGGWEFVEGTSEYQVALEEIGIFRNGNTWDIVSLCIVVILLFWTIIALINVLKRGNLAAF